MEAQALIDQIYAHVECGDTDKAVFASVRLARSVGDVFNLVIFLRELSADKDQFSSTFYNETRSLKEEAQKFLWETSLKYWLAGRTLDGFSFGSDNGGEKNVLTSGVGELQRELENFEECIKDIHVPAGMGEFDTAAFTDRYVDRKALIRNRIRANHVVLERIRTRCHDYASRIEKQIAAQSGNVDFLNEAQAVVNNFFAARSKDVYNKLLKAAELAQKKDVEDQALLLTAVRRALKAVADHFYPPVDGDIVCGDGKSRRLGDDQYLNRLQEFCMQLLTNSKADALVKAELDYLSIFVRRLNDVACKGVHSKVSHMEARQGLIGIYMFLFNIVNRLEMAASNNRLQGTLHKVSGPLTRDVMCAPEEAL